MTRYLRLRMPQLLLIISVALPLALVFSFNVTSSGMIDTDTFLMVFIGCVNVFWGGLVLYTRDTDRRRHLPDALMAYVQSGNATVSMKQNEKADIIWQILQDDALYRKQLRLWGRGLVLMMAKGASWMPAILLSAACLMFWFAPGDVVQVIKNWRDADLACVVYTVANLLFSLFVSTGAMAGLLCVMEKKEGEIICFRAAYQEKLHQFARQQITQEVASEAKAAPAQEVGE